VGTLKHLFNIPDKFPAPVANSIIWISRKGLNDRNIEWEDKILAQFPQIEKVDLSLLDVDETIAKFQYVTHVIAPHGAGLSNIYICAQGTKILEVYPDDAYFKPCFYRLSAICKLEHAVMYLDFKNSGNTKTGLQAFNNAFTKFAC